MSGNDYFNLVINDVYNDINYLKLGLQLVREEYNSSNNKHYDITKFLTILSNHYKLFNSCIDNNILDDIFSLPKFINLIKTKFKFDDILNNKTNRYRNVFLKIKNSLFYTYPEYVPLIGTYQNDSLEKITINEFLLFIYQKKLITNFTSLLAFFPDLNDYLLKELYPIPIDFNITLPFSAYIYMIENNIYKYPRTLITGKYAKFDKHKNRFHILDNNTQQKDPLFIKITNEKRKNTCLERFGVENPTQNEYIRQKVNKICIEKFGFKCALKNDIIKQKSKNTCLERFGVENPAQNKDIKQKMKNTCLERFGVENPAQNKDIRQKMKNTCLERFGVGHPSQNEEIKNKRKNTFIEKFGVENPSQNEKIKEKGLETKRKNKSFNISKPEEEIYKLLILKFGETHILREYNEDSRYPFLCDFYISCLDMFIEYQGTWSHGQHPFDLNSEEDIKLLNKWKSKNFEKHPSYEKAINNWTVRDPLKRETAKKNNLNYVELWSLEEAIQFIDELPYLTSI